jgi:hypothetical protein
MMRETVMAAKSVDAVLEADQRGCQLDRKVDG